jgi:hydroxyacylglutathione hydrolase
MKIKTISVGPFEMNCYVVSEDNYPECLIIDPGDEPDKIIVTIEKAGLNPVKIINTHNHIDHARRVSDIQKHFKIPFYICENDQPLLETLREQAMLFGLDASELPQIEGYLKDGDTFKLVEKTFKILHTPGHSPGSISIFTEGHVFVGDVLFKDSIGRTDLYGGDYNVLIRSIREKLLVLPGDTIVYSGHGPATTIGREKKMNPFLNPSQSPF